MAHLDIALCPDTLNAAVLHAGFLARHGASGAVASFTGVVRGTAQGAVVDYLYLDWYSGMTETSLEGIATAANERFNITALCLYHRCGRVQAGAPVVFVAAASPHRRAAFDAVDYVMDRLKSEAAFWKREAGPDLDRWIEPTARDREDLQRWETK